MARILEEVNGPLMGCDEVKNSRLVLHSFLMAAIDGHPPISTVKAEIHF